VPIKKQLIKTIKKCICTGLFDQKQFLKTATSYINNNHVLTQHEIHFLKINKNRLSALLLILPFKTDELKKMFKVYLNLYQKKSTIYKITRKYCI